MKYKGNPSQFYDMVDVNSIDNTLYDTDTKIDFIIIRHTVPNIYDIMHGLEKIIKKYHPKIIFTIVINFNDAKDNKNKATPIMDSHSKDFLDWLN